MYVQYDMRYENGEGGKGKGGGRARVKEGEKEAVKEGEKEGEGEEEGGVKMASNALRAAIAAVANAGKSFGTGSSNNNNTNEASKRNASNNNEKKNSSNNAASVPASAKAKSNDTSNVGANQNLKSSDGSTAPQASTNGNKSNTATHPTTSRPPLAPSSILKGSGQSSAAFLSNSNDRDHDNFQKNRPSVQLKYGQTYLENFIEECGALPYELQRILMTIRVRGRL